MLLGDWKRVLRRAWSVRLMLLSGLLTGCEVVLPLYVDALPRALFAALSFAVVIAALFARLMTQRGGAQ